MSILIKKFLTTLIFLFICFLTPGCLQTENSSSLDPSFFGGGDSAFLEVREIMIDYCVRCHANYVSTAAELISQGLVAPGDAYNSPLYYRIKFSEGPMTPKDMPQNGPLVPSDDLLIIRDWIDSL